MFIRMGRSLFILAKVYCIIPSLAKEAQSSPINTKRLFAYGEVYSYRPKFTDDGQIRNPVSKRQKIGKSIIPEGRNHVIKESD